MSHVSWHNYGFGICTDPLAAADVSRIRELIHCAPAYEAKVEDLLRDSGISEATADDYLELEINNCYGIASIMAEVIREAEDVLLTACDNMMVSNICCICPPIPGR